jgi:phosphoribosylaminoimidazolecarboxamide formyltransferase/IMP cyclohydrolase
VNLAYAQRNALISSYEKNETLLTFARFLRDQSWRIYASEGTHNFLKRHDIPSKNISDIVGHPILGHRVVTLSRELHAGLLAHTEEDMRELSNMNVPAFGLVYCTLYPLEKTIRESGGDSKKVTDGTDIGGPTLLRSAAKGMRIVVADPLDLSLAERMVTHGYDIQLIARLNGKAERTVSHYAKLSAEFWEDYDDDITGVES